MTDADDGLDRLRAIRIEFAAFCERYGKISEADTRAKVIDRVLREVFLWPESTIRREENSAAGYLDYSLRVHDKRFVVVEAKREGIPFVVPDGELTAKKTWALNGTLVTNNEIKDAIEQGRRYCSEEGIRYCIVTNGYTWIVFRALREDMPWRGGRARVFPSLDFLIQNFTDAWNLLSYPAVVRGALDNEFGSPTRVSRTLARVSQRLFNADLPLQRNRLHSQLAPIIDTFFADIADREQIDLLNRCYVHSGSLHIVASDLNFVIEDDVPRFLKAEGTENIEQGPDHAGEFGRAIGGAIATDPHSDPSHPAGRGRLYLLLGGIGSGKTTFLRRYQRTVGASTLSKQTLWFHIEFLAAPVEPGQMEGFVWTKILDDLRTRHAEAYPETRQDLKRLFFDKLRVAKQTSLRSLIEGSADYEHQLGLHLDKWRENASDYVPRLLRYRRSRNAVSIVIFIDNVDQLSADYQAKIFLLAQHVTGSVGAVTILSMREESYYSASIQKVFTAYTNQKFHIASPRFRKLIGNRIGYALQVLRSADTTETVVGSRVDMDTDAILDFLRIVEESIFENNKQIARFIDAISFGNMRAALQMFATFLTSGVTDVDKMLRIYRRDGAYYVAYHEFVKSVMLGDRRYYKESESPIMNLFDCGTEKNSSHFTTLRLLNLLLAHRGESSPEGQGYVEIGSVVATFEDRFDNREDCLRSMERLVSRQLVEIDTKSVSTLEGAKVVRITSAGWYYVRYLVSRFAYLDLVLQDTPLNDETVEPRLRKSVDEVDNLGDREEEKVARISARFSRVDVFLTYLEREEGAERRATKLDEVDSIVSQPLMAPIRDRFERERDAIRRRVDLNRERYAEPVIIEVPDDEASVLGADDEGDPEPKA